MATPAKLNGLASSMTIDGTDMHTYGVIVNSISNPLPQVRRAAVEVPGVDGDFDFTKHWGPRVMTLDCSIIADTAALLLTQIDSVKQFFRLRENGDPMILIFQNESTKQWSVRFDGGLDFQFNSLWKSSKTATFRVQLKGIKPYAEKTTLTTGAYAANSYSHKAITYAGTFPTPISFRMTEHSLTNIVDKKVSASASEDHTKWTAVNSATLATNPSVKWFGSNSVTATKASGAFGAEIDVTTEITLTKNYVFVVSFPAVLKGGTNEYVKLIIVNNGAGGNIEATHNPSTSAMGVIFAKVSAAQLAGATSVKFQISCQNIYGDAFIYIDGAAIYEISAAEFADSAYVPFPYVSYASASAIRFTSTPKLIVLSGNILENSGGDTKTNWTSTTKLQVVSDPLDPSKKCLMAIGTDAIYSPKAYVSAGAIYQLRYEYLCAYTGGVAYIGFEEYNENNGVDWDASMNDNQTAWATKVLNLTIPTWCNALALKLIPAAGRTIYVKNVSITRVATIDAATIPYAKYNGKKIEISATFNANDSLFYSSNDISAQFYDDSAGTIANAMQYVSGERLMLIPGTNYLVYKDARITSSTPDVVASGVADMIYSYRERYL